MTQHVSTDWIMDSNATHYITNDLDNLHITNSYHAQDQLKWNILYRVEGNTSLVRNEMVVILP